MKKNFSFILKRNTWLIAIAIAFVSVLFMPQFAKAEDPDPDKEGPDRYQSISVDVELVEWWMARWKKDEIVCSFFVDHPGLPNSVDISSACEKEIFTEWEKNNSACTEKDPKDCPGFYFINISQKSSQKELIVKLPSPSVTVRLDNCELDEKGWCTAQPNLVLTGIEPLPNERITAIHGYAGEDSFDCEGDGCIFKLSETSADGVRLTFWADSSYGDHSATFDALVRVTKDPNDKRLLERWQVDVFSTQWEGPEIASCAAVWETFRPEEGLPNWLTTPKNSTGLKSNIPYDYLASNLIQQGVTNASQCPDGGLFSDGSVNACGLEAAKKDVEEWQNRFDKVILKVSKQKEVPAQLLKNLFSRESQFWPGVFRNGKDVGLGQMTEGGADTALLWNPIFYNGFCPLVLDVEVCQTYGYANLSKNQQLLLQGALVNSVDARCDTCPLGLDLSRADFSIGIFAHTLLANCEQAGKIVENVTGDKPGLSTDLETMWKFTLVNYNAGSGCLSDAVTNAYDPSIDQTVSWDNVAANLNLFCPGAVDYVNDISTDRSLTEPTQP